MNLMRGIDLKKIAGKMNAASGAELKVCPYVSRNILSFGKINNNLHGFWFLRKYNCYFA